MFNFIDNINSLDSKIQNFGQKKLYRPSDFDMPPKPITEKGVNGCIDENIWQGDYLDCWLIAGVLSMSYTEAGAEIINDSIKIKSNGDVDILFPDSENTYTVSKDEMKNHNVDKYEPGVNYSCGDDDMLAIELALEEMIEEENITKYNFEDGGNPYYTYKLYGAEDINITKTKQDIDEAFKYFEDNKDKCSMTINIIDKSVCGLKVDHSYALKSIDKNGTVHIVDPWDTTKDVTANKEDLINNYKNVSIVYTDFE